MIKPVRLICQEPSTSEQEVSGLNCIGLSRLFVDKYQPSNLTDIVSNQPIISLLQYYLKEKNFPNMLLIGPTGCGKNTAISLFVKEYLGKYYNSHCLEIFGSLYRGRCIVSSNNENNKSNEKSVPNISNFIKKSLIPKGLLRVVVIYDFDYTTNETQMSLRRLMETKYNQVRFILSSNSRNNISETIQSRCNIHQFNLIPDDQLICLLQNIKERENLTTSDDVLKEIIACSEGNIRTAINNLQLISCCPEITVERLYQILNIPSIQRIEKLFLYCFSGQEKQAIECLNELISNGYSIVDLLNIFVKTLIYTDKIGQGKKNDVIEILGKFFLLNETTLSITNLYHLIYSLLETKK